MSVRAAIEKVTREGCKEDPLLGGEVFLHFLRLVVGALGSQWAHLNTGIYELQTRVAELLGTLEQEKQAEARRARKDRVDFPAVGEAPLPASGMRPNAKRADH